MNNKLIHPSDLKDSLKSYRYFCDELCRLVHIDNFMTLFYYKYGAIDDIFQFWIHDDKLHCQNVGGFEIIFPLSKKLII